MAITGHSARASSATNLQTVAAGRTSLPWNSHRGAGCRRDAPPSSLLALAGRVMSLPGVFLAGVAHADTLDLRGTTVTLQPSDGALAEVIFDNRSVNLWPDNGDYPLTLGALTVTVTFTWDAVGGADGISLTVPPGVVCAPACDLALPEGDVGRITLHDLESVGM